LSFKKGRVLKALPFLFFESQQRPIVIFEPMGILDFSPVRKSPSRVEGKGDGSLMNFIPGRKAFLMGIPRPPINNLPKDRL
jgi:hypothetical protein